MENPVENKAVPKQEHGETILIDLEMTMGPSFTPDNQNENQTGHSLNQMEVQQLLDQVEHYKQSTASLETQLAEEIQQKRNLKLKLQSRDELVQKLLQEVERRDKIFDICCNRGAHGQDVFMESNSDGKRIFEIQDKLQVPFMVKIERLSPLLHEHAEIIMSSDEDDDNNDDNYHENNIEVPQTSKKYESPKQEPSSSNLYVHESSSNSNSLHSSPLISVSKSRSASASTSSRLRKRSISPCQNQKEHRQIEKRSKTRERSPSFSYEHIHNVLSIPKVFRTNYGSSEWELGQSLEGTKFFYDPDNSHMTKYYIRLYDDSGDWRRSKFFTVKEQIGLCIPTSCHLRFPDLISKLEKTPNSRIWLDMRSFNTMILYSSVQHILPPKILASVSHFSFGGRLQSDFDSENGNSSENDDRQMSNELLEFIFSRLPNLEFCCINNGLLKPFDCRPGRYPHLENLNHLTTVQLVHSNKQKFSTHFILSILKMSPHLRNFYDLPLHNLRELSLLKTWETSVKTNKSSSSSSSSNPHPTIKMINIFDRVSIRSVYIRRDCYNKSDQDALNFLEDLRILAQQRWNTLKEMNTTLSFLVCKQATRTSCREKISKIVMRNAETLERIKVGTSSFMELDIQRLKKVTTLGFYLAINSGFSHTPVSKQFGFDIPLVFPALTKVEMAVDFLNADFKQEKTSPLCVFNRHFPGSIFKPGYTFGNVQSLKLFGFALPEIMPKMSTLFPGLKILCFHNSLVSVGSVLECVFRHWPALVELQIEINTDTKHGNLDPMISGINFSTCERLWKLKNYKLSEQEEEIKRCLNGRGDNLSIHNLIDLQRLKIMLRTCSTFLGAKEELPVLTMISALALSGVGCSERRRNKLQVVIDFDERVTSSEKKKIVSSLSPILQFSCITLER